MNQGIVLVSFCSGDLVHADFTRSLAILMQYSTELHRIHCGLQNIRCTDISQGRCSAVDQALTMEPVSHILMLDSDMKFPASLLAILLAHNKDIVGCTYSMRRSPRAATHRTLHSTSFLERADPARPLVEVASLGMGAVLIKMSVFKSISPPWFKGEWLTYPIYQGEDIFFFKLARHHGFKVWCDLPLSHHVEHLGQKAFTLNDLEVIDGEPI